jgi:ribosomal protein L15E
VSPETLLKGHSVLRVHPRHHIFIDRALSGEGQEFVGMVIARRRVRKGQKQKYERLGEPTTVPIKPELMGKDYDRFTELYRKVFGMN